VISQTLENIEIILVNNGSTDNSEQIMREYQEKYFEHRISIITQEDRGLALGRQRGIEAAHGDYIVFLDADDFVLPQAYENMYNYAIQNNLDIVEIQSYYGNKILSSQFEGIHEGKEMLKLYFKGHPGTFPMLWLRLYKRHLFDKPVMPMLYVNNEDIFAFPCLLYNADKIGYLKETLHNYSIDNENAVMTSLSRKLDLAKKYYENRILTLFVVAHIKDYIGEDNINRSYKNEFIQFKYRVIISFIFSNIHNISYKEKLKKVKQIFGFKDNRELHKYTRKNCDNRGRLNKVIKIFGIRNAYIILKMYNMVVK
jgi:glycosyltransferase involved in cell wall biosynthesis